MQQSPALLQRRLGLGGAVALGLGSILGTGVFVSIGLAADLVGPSALVAIALAGLVATCNALSSAQLAAAHPVAGGTYEYGYRCLTPALGFSAGWMFLAAKSASAATAALGFAGYFLQRLSGEDAFLVPLAALTVVLMTLVVLGGLRRSAMVNTVLVCLTLTALAVFCLAGAPTALAALPGTLQPFWTGSAADLAQATALMFVAYTGYGRIATMGEEVRQPEVTIPRAIILTMLVTMFLYLAVAAVGLAAVGGPRYASALQEDAAPLATIAEGFSWSAVPAIVAVGAMLAMLGVLLNLILGLSRVWLAMARRGDMPTGLARLDRAGATPLPAVLLTGAVILGLCLLGDIAIAWSFSAFTVLIYYGLTNAAALRLPPSARRYPRWISWLGLAACLFLSAWLQWQIIVSGLGLLLLGYLWHRWRRRQPPLAGFQ